MFPLFASLEICSGIPAICEHGPLTCFSMSRHLVSGEYLLCLYRLGHRLFAAFTLEITTASYHRAHPSNASIYTPYTAIEAEIADPTSKVAREVRRRHHGQFEHKGVSAGQSRRDF